MKDMKNSKTKSRCIRQLCARITIVFLAATLCLSTLPVMRGVGNAYAISETTIPVLKQAVDSAQNTRDQLDGEVSNLLSDLNEKKQAKETAQTADNEAETELTNAEQNKNAKQSAKNAADTAKINAQSALDAANAALSSATAAVQTAQTEVDTKQELYDTAEAEYNDALEQINKGFIWFL